MNSDQGRKHNASIYSSIYTCRNTILDPSHKDGAALLKHTIQGRDSHYQGPVYGMIPRMKDASAPHTPQTSSDTRSSTRHCVKLNMPSGAGTSLLRDDITADSSARVPTPFHPHPPSIYPQRTDTPCPPFRLRCHSCLEPPSPRLTPCTLTQARSRRFWCRAGMCSYTKVHSSSSRRWLILWSVGSASFALECEPVVAWKAFSRAFPQQRNLFFQIEVRHPPPSP